MCFMFLRAAIGTLISLSACSPLSGQDAPDNLPKYVSCQFGEKVKVQESAERATPFLRPIETQSGNGTVNIAHAFSLHIGYDATPFVNFKAERLDWSNYQQDKKTLLRQLTDLTSTQDMESSKPRPSSLNGFDLYGINRKQLEGGVLSVYLLFRDVDHTVVTLYFLNTPPEDPKFRSIEQAHKLRDDFLSTYTSCVNRNLQQSIRDPDRACSGAKVKSCPIA